VAKKTARMKRHRCREEGCRKLQALGSDFCAAHAGSADPVDYVIRLTELERLQFNESDIAIRNHKQEIRILDQEQQLESVAYASKKATRQSRVDELRGSTAQRIREQRDLVLRLGEKYEFDPKHVSIDDITGVVHEHPPEE